jgi:hypothetical protein
MIPRVWMLALAGVCVFAVVAFVMLEIMPAPLKESDYLVVGSVATLVALLVLFLVMIATTRSNNVFFRKRKK